MMAVRLRLSRARGFRKIEGAIACTRPGPWGNPFVIGAPVDLRQINRWGWVIADKRHVTRTREEAVALFRRHLLADPAGLARVRELRGRDLYCWCDAADLCHADVLLELANA